MVPIAAHSVFPVLKSIILGGFRRSARRAPRRRVLPVTNQDP